MRTAIDRLGKLFLPLVHLALQVNDNIMVIWFSLHPYGAKAGIVDLWFHLNSYAGTLRQANYNNREVIVKGELKMENGYSAIIGGQKSELHYETYIFNHCTDMLE